MRETLKETCRRFIENRDTLKSAYKWENNYIYPVCAAVLSKKGTPISTEKLKECGSMLKENTSVFSVFRGNIRLLMISLMSIDEDPKKRLDKTVVAYTYLKKQFMSSDHLCLAAILIADMAEEYRFEELAARTRRIYEKMRSDHPMLTSSEDVSYAAMLSFLGHSEQRIADEAERCYVKLKKVFKVASSAQSVSQVFAAFDENADEKCRAIKDLYDELKERGFKFGKYYELATLGVLAMMKKDHPDIVNDIIDAQGYLSGCKGYSTFWGFPKTVRLTHAAMLVAYDLAPDLDVTDITSFNGAVAMIVAQQVAICTAIIAVQASNT